MALDLPTTYLLSTHLPEEARLQLEDEIPNLTYDITKAKLVLGKVATKQRAEFELRSRKLWTKEVEKKGEKENGQIGGQRGGGVGDDGPARKKRRIGSSSVEQGKEVIVLDSSTESEDEKSKRRAKSAERRRSSTQSRDTSPPPQVTSSPPRKSSQDSAATSVEDQAEPEKIEWGDTIKVVKLAWYEKCVAAGRMLPLDGHLVYEGRPIPRPEVPSTPLKTPPKYISPDEIMSRARSDSPHISKSGYAHPKAQPSQLSQPSQPVITRPTKLLHQTTSEHDDPSKLPPVPEYLHTQYSCQRPTPLHTPNDAFIALLKRIRQVRELTDDEVGVRAYSSSIASLAAYPHALTSAQEIVRLPGCSEKVATLWREFHERGRIAEVDEMESDPEIQILSLFYNIWGVGPKGARDFYYRKGWRDLDDVVEFGWESLSRVQQIGVKYYDEFLLKIPRDEVERIGGVILEAANRVAPGCQMTIVGGHRRGKPESGDVDVVVSNPDEAKTHQLVTRIVEEIERGRWITHTLLLSTANSDRDQTPVSWKGNAPHGGAGFDTLDKALVVWQDPAWPTRDADLAADPDAKNPNVHRRVDIIVSPWRTVGCAVAGWTSGTTFQRDMRRYVKHELGLKFDSSGVRNRQDGGWVDLEGIGGKAADMLTAEKRVFEGLGLEWREPTERCTG